VFNDVLPRIAATRDAPHSQAGHRLPSLDALAAYVSTNYNLNIGDDLKFLVPRRGARGRCARLDAEVLGLKTMHTAQLLKGQLTWRWPSLVAVGFEDISIGDKIALRMSQTTSGPVPAPMPCYCMRRWMN
jgi:hypothetical protein